MSRRRSAWQEWRLDRLADRMDLRHLAQEVGCDDCDAEVGKPCVNRYGEPLLKMDHVSRIRKAERARGRGQAC
ncbi:MAG TPA: hypothetical protein VGP26_24670 [Actinophytocola sp.]|jgi:hypothetical protein|nr:hypothetical protein [Actinophytocola sp.]